MTREYDLRDNAQLATTESCEQQIDALDESDIRALVQLFKLLDRWDRDNAKVM
jgi:hypothetical protein